MLCLQGGASNQASYGTDSAGGATSPSTTTTGRRHLLQGAAFPPSSGLSPAGNGQVSTSTGNTVPASQASGASNSGVGPGITGGNRHLLQGQVNGAAYARPAAPTGSRHLLQATVNGAAYATCCKGPPPHLRPLLRPALAVLARPQPLTAAMFRPPRPTPPPTPAQALQSPAGTAAATCCREPALTPLVPPLLACPPTTRVCALLDTYTAANVQLMLMHTFVRAPCAPEAAAGQPWAVAHLLQAPHFEIRAKAC